MNEYRPIRILACVYRAKSAGRKKNLHRGDREEEQLGEAGAQPMPCPLQMQGAGMLFVPPSKHHAGAQKGRQGHGEME